jgi:Tol biopolymer transport system component/Zn-dependent M28 family amino/carboxypeptidase
MKGAPLCLLFLATCCPPEAAKPATPIAIAPRAEPRDLAAPGETHLENVRQLTFGGDNAEAYWAFGGDKLILQTNKAPYKCDQIEVLTIADQSTKLVSTGKGRTTCSYFLKGDQEIVYASTHESSPTCPTPPDMSKGYLWGLFDFDVYRANADGSNLRNLTPSTPGYDAEATVCPADGSIIFTSTRSGDLELWRMDADGKNLKQLTNQPGYDGGAFFSADCSKIVWRSSRPQGKDLEEYKALLAQNLVKPTKMDLYVANADGSDARQITYLPGASFAPFFYPDGKRVIFASNYLDPRSAEFDLFGINIDGTGLERITFSGGFDGFPVFSPDGKTLAFSSNRRDVVDGKYRVTGTPAGAKDTNVFLADWVDAPAAAVAPETASADRIAKLITYLAADEREGRGVGTKGLEDSLTTVERELASFGVEPGMAGSWRQPFEVTTEVRRGATTALALDGKPLAPDDFAPMPASASGSATGAIVAVGYGLVDEASKRDDYRGKNVKGKIVLAYRFTPADAKLDPSTAARLADLRLKAFNAKQRGAKALLVVDAGDPKQAEAPLPKLSAAESESQIPIVVITRKAAAALEKGTHQAKVTVALDPVRTKTTNLVGVIRAGAANKQPGVVVLGAHIDHLGMGGPDALDPQVNDVHNGADDNASGVATLVEAARTIAAKKSELSRDVYIIAFSGEEMGDLGSFHYVKNAATKEPIVAMLNLDMVGRMRMGQLHINGGDSAKEWKEVVLPACKTARVECTVTGSGYGPSDHMPFYVAGIPVLFLFTGNHLDYHTAKDDSAKINATGAARVAMITSDVAITVANRTSQLTYVKSPPELLRGGDARRRGASLGTVPSYSEDPNQPKGVLLSDVVPEGPAMKAGLKGGDLIVQIGTTEIASVSDLMYVLGAAKAGEKTTITYVRNGKTEKVEATFGTPRAH